MQNYLELLKDVMTNGVNKTDRTGVGTRSVFGRQLRFDLQEGFPLVTTKKVFIKGIIAETLWFLRGDTNIRYLLQNGVRIWSDWPYKNYMKSLEDFSPSSEVTAQLPQTKEGFEKAVAENMEYKIPGFDFEKPVSRYFADEWGDLGPVYGKQWRAWESIVDAAPRMSPRCPARVGVTSDWVTDDKGKAYAVKDKIDQLAQAVHTLKTNPDSRRIIVTAWNPADLEEMAVRGLPPCHYVWQVVTRTTTNGPRILDLMINIRSSDVFLGLPFNIAGYALIAELLAMEVGMTAGDLIVSTGDTHLYSNHLDQASLQVSRTPLSLPRLIIKPGKSILATDLSDPSSYTPEDFTLLDYTSHPSIQAQVAV